MSFWGAAWRIASDVAIYRLRKREAANLITSITLAAALGDTPRTLLVRGAFGALLNLFVYLVNDCFDVAIDLKAPGRDSERTRFLADHRMEAWATAALLALALLIAGALAGGGLFLAAAVNIVVIVAYSGWLKHRPLADLVAMGVWGLSMAMVGFAPGRLIGWKFAALLGLLCMVTEAVQVLRDEASDRAAGVKTTAVVLGPALTAKLARGLVLASALYATVALDARVGPMIALGALVPLDPARANKGWDALRVIFGGAWLALLIAYRLGI